MTPAERAVVFERALRPALQVLADPASPRDAVAFARDVLDEVTRLIDALHAAPRDSDPPAVSPKSPSPRDARARARKVPGDEDREADGL